MLTYKIIDLIGALNQPFPLNDATKTVTTEEIPPKTPEEAEESKSTEL